MALIYSILAVSQASGIVVCTVRPPDVRTTAVTTYTLFRGPAATGPWTQIEQRRPNPLATWVNLFDITPLYGVPAFYFAQVDDGSQSNVLSFIAIKSPPAIQASAGISVNALGPYPLLGSDVFLDPATGEGVIGPNGDLLTVNGLELLGQDLRIRLITEKGELLLHSDFGLAKNRVIGGGQTNAVAQAQLLRTLIMDAVLSDPRVDSIISVTLSYLGGNPLS